MYVVIHNKDEYLAHYGVGHNKGGGSGRYPWGSGDRPYQRTRFDGVKGALKTGAKALGKGAVAVVKGTGKVAEGVGKVGIAAGKGIAKGTTYVAKKASDASKASKEKKAIRKQQEAAKKRDEDFRTMDAKTALTKYKGELSNTELQYLSDRLRLEDSIRNYRRNKLVDEISYMAKNAGKLVDSAQTGIKVWNTIADIYNFTNPTSPMQKIGQPRIDKQREKDLKSLSREAINAKYKGALSSQEIKDLNTRFSFEDKYFNKKQESSNNTKEQKQERQEKQSTSEKKNNTIAETVSRAADYIRQLTDNREKINADEWTIETPKKNNSSDNTYTQKKTTIIDYYPPEYRRSSQLMDNAVSNISNRMLPNNSSGNQFLLEDKKRKK